MLPGRFSGRGVNGMAIKFGWGFAFSLAGIFLLDLATKQLILAYYPLHTSQPVIPGFLNLVHIQNKGVAFGFLSSGQALWRTLFLTLLPTLAILGILAYVIFFTPRDRKVLWALGGISGGALGNLLDRIRYQAVVDFLDFFWGRVHWPAFNVADSAITVGVFYLVWRTWRTT
jgi:signal peptidase II